MRHTTLLNARNGRIRDRTVNLLECVLRRLDRALIQTRRRAEQASLSEDRLAKHRDEFEISNVLSV